MVRDFYGIDLGTSNSTICSIDEHGQPRPFQVGQGESYTQEVKEIVDRIERGRCDPSYTTSTLKKDFERLRELNQIKDITAADAMETIALSDARREMAQIVSDIMCQEHRFSIVGEGFDGLDMREAYIIRMKRYIDDAEVEIIVSPNKEKGENDLYYRINNQCYTDEQTMNILLQDHRTLRRRKSALSVHCYCDSLSQKLFAVQQ